MADNFIGEIRLMGFNYAPMGWHYCDGSTLSFGQFAALGSLLSYNFGGNGSTTFGLPNLTHQTTTPTLTGLAVIGQGVAASGAAVNRVFAQVYGETGVTITQTSMPTHSHDLVLGERLAADMGPTPGPTTYLGVQPLVSGTYLGNSIHIFSDTPTMTLSSMIGPAGTSPNGPHSNQQPYLVLNYCIALDGDYPSFP